VMEYYLVIKDNDQRLPVYQGNLKKETWPGYQGDRTLSGYQRQWPKITCLSR
jgi:hypothetical protein